MPADPPPTPCAQRCPSSPSPVSLPSLSLPGSYLVFELMECDLKAVMDGVRGVGLAPPQVKALLHQLLAGVDACHAHRIVHRDLKVRRARTDGALRSLASARAAAGPGPWAPAAPAHPPPRHTPPAPPRRSPRTSSSTARAAC